MERGTEATLHSVKVFIVSLLVGGKKKKDPYLFVFSSMFEFPVGEE